MLDLFSQNACDLDQSKLSLCGTGLNSCSPSPFRNEVLNSSKLKEFADGNFKFYINVGKFSKWLEKHCGRRGTRSL